MDATTIETYNKMYREYDEETADFWERFPHSFFDRFAELAVGPVLDVGSGPGRDGLMLQTRGLDVTCLDASEKMIDMCMSRGLKGVVGDFCSLPFGDASFGSAWSYTALLHVPKTQIDGPICEIRRVLHPGGIFALGLIEGDEELYRESAGVSMPRWFSYYSKSKVEELLSKHGFQVLYIEEFQPRSRNYLNYISRKV